MTDAPTPLTYDSDRLIREWRDRYAGRRTVSREMLDQAEVLVRDAIACEVQREQYEAKTEREYELERREHAVEMAERRGQWDKDRLRRELAEAKAKIESLSTRQTLMRESRETVEDGTVIRLLAPTVPSYGDKNEPRPWMLAELEDVIYRLRIGGAVDSTEVRFKRDAIEACVPFAEFALMPPPPQGPTPDRTPQRAIPPIAQVGLAIVAVLLLLGLLVGVLT